MAYKPEIPPEKARAGQVMSWSMYDFANTIFSMNVVSLYFPLLIVVSLGYRDIYVAVANSLSMLVVAVSAPFLGQLTDTIGRRKPALFIATAICCAATVAIGFYARAGVNVYILLALFFVANIAYQIGLVFYNSLLPSVAPKGMIGRIGGIGVAVGYIGSIVGMIFVLPFNEGALFGIDIPWIEAGGREATFIPTAILFVIFSLPIFLFLKEKRNPAPPIDNISPVKMIIETLRDTKKYPGIRRFLVGKLFFQEGIETAILFMGVYSEKAIGLGDSLKIQFFVVATAFAAVGSWFFGKVVDRHGAWKTLMGVLVGWVISLVVLVLLNGKMVFFGMGAIIGILLGGVWTASRPLLIELSPPENIGRFFGLYSLSGKTAAILGPILWGLSTLLLGGLGDTYAYKGAILVLAVMIAVGAVVLRPLKRDIEDRLSTRTKFYL